MPQDMSLSHIVVVSDAHRVSLSDATHSTELELLGTPAPTGRPAPVLHKDLP